MVNPIDLSQGYDIESPSTTEMCRRYTRVNVIGNKLSAILLTCKRWNCRFCRPYMKSELLTKAKEALGDEATLVLLTENGKGYNGLRRFFNYHLKTGYPKVKKLKGGATQVR